MKGTEACIVAGGMAATDDILYGDIGMVLFVPVAVAYLLVAGLGRAMARTRRAAQVDRAINAEARRRGRSAPTLH